MSQTSGVDFFGRLRKSNSSAVYGHITVASSSGKATVLFVLFFLLSLPCPATARRGWDLATADVEKAFLQGVTYEELSRLTGEPQREVNFYLPASSIPILRKLPGFENFDASSEVLHCDKPGTGLVDAPRAFSLKLGIITRKCGLLPTSVDGELCICHQGGRLVGLVAKHVDDLKIAGERQWIEWLAKQLEATFGPLKLVFHEFTNCGVRHIQNKTTKEITLDQVEYIAALKPIQHMDLV